MCCILGDISSSSLILSPAMPSSALQPTEDLLFHTVFPFQIYLFVSNYPVLIGHFLLSLFYILFLTISLSVILGLFLLTFNFSDLFSHLIGDFCVSLTAWF